MSGDVGADGPGLRERKKLWVRARLIEAALELSDRQGYDATTVHQIADAVDVSPRTFARYFSTKDGVITALLEHLTAAVNDELERVDPALPPLEALLAANVNMLRRAAGGVGPMTTERITKLLRIVNTSPTLQALSIAVRTRQTAIATARRLGTTPDSATVRLIAAVWSAIIAHAWGMLGTEHGEFDLDATHIPKHMHDLLLAAVAEFSAIAVDSAINPPSRLEPQ